MHCHQGGRMSSLQNNTRNEQQPSLMMTSGRWEDFCKKHGTTAAKQFAREVKHFVDNNPVYEGMSSATIFAKKFVEYFNQTFSAELMNITFADFSEPDSPSAYPFAADTKWESTSNSHHNSREQGQLDVGVKARSKFNLRQLFSKRSSSMDSPGNSQHNGNHHDNGKLRQLAIPVDNERAQNEIRKDSILDYLVNLDSGADLEEFFWQKCRVLLYKAPGGYMLEFYAPPKV